MEQKEKNAKQEPTFEAAMARLEEIVQALERGTAPLDESLGLFEEGVSLVKLCNAKLDTAAQKITMMTAGPDGEARETPFAGTAE